MPAGVRLIEVLVVFTEPVEPVKVLDKSIMVETELVTVPAVLETVTAVDDNETVAKEADGEKCTVTTVDDNTVVTVPRVALEIFIFPPTTFVVTVPVTVVDAVILTEETVKVFITVTAWVLSIVTLVDVVTDIVPDVMLTIRLPSAFTKIG